MAAFAVAQRGFGSHALGDVAPDRGDENAFVRFPAAQRHVERDQAALFAAAGDLKRARGAAGIDEGRARRQPSFSRRISIFWSSSSMAE